jgi:hypothetical protein
VIRCLAARREDDPGPWQGSRPPQPSPGDYTLREVSMNMHNIKPEIVALVQVNNCR